MARRAASANGVEQNIKNGQNAIAEAKQLVQELSAALSAEQTGERVADLTAALAVQVDTAAAGMREIIGHWEGVKERYHVGERIIQAQEEAWRRVARDIHDGPAQALANIVLRAEICERLMAAGRPEIGQELAQLKLLVKESLREVRKIIFDLRPMALDDLGLIPTLHRYLENMQAQNGTPVSLQVAGEDRRLSTSLEAALFRVVQEATNNARKHAQATKIEVLVTFSDTDIAVRIADDGIGFDMAGVVKSWHDRQSFGLMSMRERIELLDGEFAVASRKGKGTVINVRVPCIPAEAADH